MTYTNVTLTIKRFDYNFHFFTFAFATFLVEFAHNIYDEPTDRMLQLYILRIYYYILYILSVIY